MKKIGFACLLFCLVGLPSMTYAMDDYKSNGVVGFEENEAVTNPVDPTNPIEPVEPIDPNVPDGKPNPGQKGPLSIDFASSFSFGVNKISNKNQVYYADAQYYEEDLPTPNYVQVTDYRGTLAGWTLTVKQLGQFQSAENVKYKTLPGVAISLNDIHINSTVTDTAPPTSPNSILLVPDSSEQLVLQASSGEGGGTWEEYWGRLETISQENPDGTTSNRLVTKAVALAVPGKTPKSATTYSTTFVWSLKEIPKN